ncbi:MAG: transcription elongation factor GreA [Candidatus Brennerbacteria bacterium]|nr:transcription elongation factor GreA [Candidatus Brennerbacteria bacterium]
MSEYVYLTKERLEELQKELVDLKSTGRQEIAERLKRAKELGDLSENSEYFEARESQERLELRIGDLEELIKNAVIIKKVTGSSTVKVGSTIKVQKDGKISTYTIVGSNESQPEKGFISNESPLGRAFLGHKVGDSVSVKIPAGIQHYKIIAIE